MAAATVAEAVEVLWSAILGEGLHALGLGARCRTAAGRSANRTLLELDAGAFRPLSPRWSASCESI